MKLFHNCVHTQVCFEILRLFSKTFQAVSGYGSLGLTTSSQKRTSHFSTYKDYCLTIVPPWGLGPIFFSFFHFLGKII